MGDACRCLLVGVTLQKGLVRESVMIGLRWQPFDERCEESDVVDQIVGSGVFEG